MSRHGKPVPHGRRTIETLLSDDSHVIALALVAAANLLVSEDGDLIEDFKRELDGSACRIKEYDSASKSKLNKTKEKHRRLLTKAECDEPRCGAV